MLTDKRLALPTFLRTNTPLQYGGLNSKDSFMLRVKKVAV